MCATVLFFASVVKFQLVLGAKACRVSATFFKAHKPFYSALHKIEKKATKYLSTLLFDMKPLKEFTKPKMDLSMSCGCDMNIVQVD